MKNRNAFFYAVGKKRGERRKKLNMKRQTRKIMIRTEDRQYEQLSREAAENGLSLSEYIRRLISYGRTCVMIDEQRIDAE